MSTLAAAAWNDDAALAGAALDASAATQTSTATPSRARAARPPAAPHVLSMRGRTAL
jgi:hypothetical protein